jgi:hypothetical protein
MALKKTVFGSRSEEKVFEHLNSVWEIKLEYIIIYHSQLFLTSIPLI